MDPFKVSSLITAITVGIVTVPRETPTSTITPPGLTAIIAELTAGELPQHSITTSNPPFVSLTILLTISVSLASYHLSAIPKRTAFSPRALLVSETAT